MLQAVAAIILSAAAHAPQPPDLAAQTEKMKAFSMLEGNWSGDGWVLTDDGKTRLHQKEEVRLMLGGAILTLHGAGEIGDRQTDATASFEAFAIISFDEANDAYAMRSYAFGHAGDFPITPRANGFTWSAPGVRYDATVEDGEWTEKGWRQLADGGEIQFIEFTVCREE